MFLDHCSICWPALSMGFNWHRWRSHIRNRSLVHLASGILYFELTTLLKIKSLSVAVNLERPLFGSDYESPVVRAIKCQSSAVKVGGTRCTFPVKCTGNGSGEQQIYLPFCKFVYFGSFSLPSSMPVWRYPNDSLEKTSRAHWKQFLGCCPQSPSWSPS